MKKKQPHFYALDVDNLILYRFIRKTDRDRICDYYFPRIGSVSGPNIRNAKEYKRHGEDWGDVSIICPVWSEFYQRGIKYIRAKGVRLQNHSILRLVRRRHYQNYIRETRPNISREADDN